VKHVNRAIRAIREKSVDEDDIESRPVWDENFASELIGKLVLVGLTHCNSDGSVDRQEQLFGIVQSAHKSAGVLLNLKGTRAGCRYNLPPDLRSYFKASPGNYRLRSTNEVVTDPDFTVTFSVHEPRKR
jgi:hypothetical protein